MHHYPFHPGDYLLATCHLDPMHDLAYRRLLDYYYSEEKPIPDDNQRVSKRIRLETSVVEDVLKEFFKLTEKGWEHTRCEAEIAHFNDRVKSCKSNGMKGGRPKKTNGKPIDNPLVLKTKPKITQPGYGYGSSSGEGGAGGREVNGVGWAERIYRAYPRTDSPMQCMAAIQSALDGGEDPQTMWQQVRDCAFHMHRAPGGASNCLIPSAETFFSKRRWPEAEVFKSRVDRLLATAEKGEKDQEPVTMQL